MTVAWQQVHVRVNDAATGKPTPCRIHFSGPHGTYYAPYGRLTDFAASWTADCAGNIITDGKEWAYIDGVCEIRLPTGPIHIEVTKGPEYKPLVQDWTLTPGKLSLRLTIERWIDMRQEGWYSGELGAHDLSPHGALLEGAGEDLAVVNLLAHLHYDNAGKAKSMPSFRMGRSAWKGEEQSTIVRGWMTPNLLAFSGQEPCLAKAGHLVVVNTRNSTGLEQLDLLNCHRVVFPLVFGQRDPEGGLQHSWTIADWCDQCHRKGGLVVWSDFPHLSLDPKRPARESLADAILGRIDAVPFPGSQPAYLYALLNCGLRLPLLCGINRDAYSDLPMGALRTYVCLQPRQEFNYKNWIEAVRAGRTFATEGPLLAFQVNGQEAGATIHLPDAKQTIQVSACLRSLAAEDRLELVFNGDVVAREGQVIGEAIPICASGWLAVRSLNSNDQITAHSSPIYLRVAGQRPRPDSQIVDALLAQLEAGRHNEAGLAASEAHRARLLSIFDDAIAILRKLLN